jgi:Holliday junction resolvase-like predicted endonuclease
MKYTHKSWVYTVCNDINRKKKYQIEKTIQWYDIELTEQDQWNIQLNK